MHSGLRRPTRSAQAALYCQASDVTVALKGSECLPEGDVEAAHNGIYPPILPETQLTARPQTKQSKKTFPLPSIRPLPLPTPVEPPVPRSGPTVYPPVLSLSPATEDCDDGPAPDGCGDAVRDVGGLAICNVEADEEEEEDKGWSKLCERQSVPQVPHGVRLRLISRCAWIRVLRMRSDISSSNKVSAWRCQFGYSPRSCCSVCR